MEEKNKDIQIVTVNIDDSGKLTKKENVSIYAGVVFFSKKEKDKFITQYKSIVNKLKCNYCKESEFTCKKDVCPELKHNMLTKSNKRQLLNYIKKYFTIGCIIDNSKIYDTFKTDTASRGRYLDYALKRLIKELFVKLIKEKKLDPEAPVKLLLNMDEQTTLSNGYYSLENSIYEELKNGIYNFNYSKFYKPILFSDFEVKLKYIHSDKSYMIQASDLIAGTLRREFLNNMDNPSNLYNRVNFLNCKIFLP